MKAIIHNDDFGLTYGFTNAIKDAFKNSVTSSTSLRVNGTAYNHAVSVYRKQLRKIGMGVHLNLTDGPAMTKHLSNNNGVYKYNFITLSLATYLDKKLLKYIKTDMEEQIKKARNDGFKIDHLDSQEHVHMIPKIFKITCQLARKYKINRIRFSNEPLYLLGSPVRDLKNFFTPRFIKFLILKFFVIINRKKLQSTRLFTSSYFYGILHTNDMDHVSFKAALIDGLKRKAKIIEILGHPAYPSSSKDRTFTSVDIREYVNSKQRKIETKTFTDKNGKLRDLLNSLEVKRATFLDIHS